METFPNHFAPSSFLLFLQTENSPATAIEISLIKNIRTKSSTIIKAAEDIDNICESIINGYLSKIQTKLETFEVKINKGYRKFEKALKEE